MDQVWQSLLAQDRANFTPHGIADFGDSQSELAATRSGTVVVPLLDIGVIRVAGPDATQFLHRLVTNDVQGLKSDRAQYNGLCSPKGRMLASFLVWREDEDLLLALSRDVLAGMLKKLSMYVLRSKAVLSDASEDIVLLGVFGHEADAALGAFQLSPPAANMGLVRFPAGTLIRLGPRRYCLAVRAGHAGDVWRALRKVAQPAGTPVWSWLETIEGIPRITLPVQEEFVPQMANFELIGGVSFHKGCYPGQEIVARTQYLGKLKRRMYLAHASDDSAPAAGTPLYSPDLPDQPCGMVMSAAASPEGGFDLLAVMQMSSAEANDVRLASPDGPALSLRPLPYAVS
jgi:folate-binding protein YgfZ